MDGKVVTCVHVNLVVGIVAEGVPNGTIGFGVNAKVLKLDPIKLGLYEGERPYPRTAALTLSLIGSYLIETLRSRGVWYAKHMQDATNAFLDLNEAYRYAVDGEYKILEADIRVGLAWAHFRAGDPVKAREEADYAKRMSADMGYHWGQVDANEILAELDKP